jgi:hypothetical protein
VGHVDPVEQVVELPPDEVATLRVPLVREGDRCVVRFTVSPTAVPEDVLEGSVDDRELGVHFNAFVLEPPG